MKTQITAFLRSQIDRFSAMDTKSKVWVSLAAIGVIILVLVKLVGTADDPDCTAAEHYINNRIAAPHAIEQISTVTCEPKESRQTQCWVKIRVQASGSQAEHFEHWMILVNRKTNTIEHVPFPYGFPNGYMP
jgi:hypothetical protein